MTDDIRNEGFCVDEYQVIEFMLSSKELPKLKTKFEVVLRYLILHKRTRSKGYLAREISSRGRHLDDPGNTRDPGLARDNPAYECGAEDEVGWVQKRKRRKWWEGIVRAG
jgi:hypothetical protein